VTAGLAVITGTEDRQHAYVALTRGTDANIAYVFTASPKLADPVPGPRPAPELARYDRITAGRTGRSASAAAAGSRDALAVLSGVLGRDGQQLSASRTWQQALGDADHLAILHAIWTAEITPARAVLPGPARGQPATGIPPRARPSGEMAVADPTDRGAGRPGRRGCPGRRDRRAGPGRGT
jgi:hypothetical protein